MATRSTPLELFDTTSLLSDEELVIASTVRRFVDEKLRPNIEQWFESAKSAKEIAAEAGSLGLLGMHLQGYDCAGTSAVAYGLACMGLEAGDSGLRGFVSVQGSLAMYSIYRWGSEEQKQEWLPRLASGQAIGCSGLTEPDVVGSSPAGMPTHAERDADDWILDGTMMWITNGPIADADITRAVQQVLSGAFRSSGQKCTATSRLVMHEDVADRFFDEFLPAVTARTVGDPQDEDTYVGPLASEAASSCVGGAVDRVVAEGARMLARTNHDGSRPGHYLAPTVLKVDDTGTDLWNEELFGTVLTVVRAPDIGHALQAANAGPFGLSVAVFTADLSTALSSIEDLNVGIIHVNSETAVADPHVPFGGNKASSYGPREQRAAARDFFTTTTTTYLKA